ncbi:hypothetical protein NLG42_13515 [Flavobacterium plurextorum]|uniref:hypothetical protein n=1 Tax=Flavobacterium TaxID=237 RepID=UPI00214D8601|nr:MULTISPECIES: hypothetical protein [Flavobacterium]UUW07122.1 hypothetical protein NLG42_13515 [Flavobacterium plurextorum]
MENYEKGRELIEQFAKEIDNSNINFNEADTRLKFIDRILIECLGWDHNSINSEDCRDGQFADYKLSLFRPVAVLEAKRTGNYFELPTGINKIIYPLKSLCKDNASIKDALQQVSGYCHARGIQIGIVSNGWQFIAFLANRNDSIPPLEGDALVIPSLDFFLKNYLEVWNYLSKNGFEKKHLEKKLIGGEEEQLPPKLSSILTDYPGIKNRNPFQTELEIISDLVLEDVIKDETIGKNFLQNCYCKSGTLSQYSLLSKQILSSRYTYLFENGDKKAILEQVATKKGLSSDLAELFANSLSKRPILLIGDVGVGKSTFIDNLLLVEAPRVFKKALTFKIDLGSKAIVALDVKKAVINLIKDQLIDNYKIDINEDNFVRFAYYRELESFKKSVIVKRLYEIDPIKAIEKEIDFLTNLILDEVTHIKKSLEYIAKNQQKQIIVFIDNCDQRNDQDQETAFLIAHEFATDWPMMVFVCLRPETFHRTKKISGALSGYHTKAFTISPPRIDDVILKRLNFAQKITSGEVVLSRLETTTSFSKLHKLITTFVNSLETNKSLFQFIENISNGNIRKAIELIKKYFGSGHVDTQKILRITEEQGFYSVPVHEILRSVIYGDNKYYYPSNSEIVNLFDIRSYDEREHFIVPIILSILSDYSINNRNQGFVSINDLYAFVQGQSFLPSTIDSALNFMYIKGLFETSEKGNVLNTQGNTILIRATSSGIYHLNYLITTFPYMEAMIVDVPIFDENIKSKIIIGTDIIERMESTLVFVNYLDDVWKNNKFSSIYFDWNRRSEELKREIEKIRQKVTQ